jgi:hypothetical protein
MTVLNQILLYLGAFFLFAWGVAHLFPTKSVVRGFGEIFGYFLSTQKVTKEIK